jgi:carboxyl-terminal processing protease
MNKLLIILLPAIIYAQNDVNPCEKLSKLSTIIKELHYQSKPIDDSMSKYVFDAFLNELDEDNRLFTAVESAYVYIINHLYKLMKIIC